ncbi:MAG: ATP-binding cassette domain-containing protein [Firmicutes bacterium]|nr:ATP-binding cassette domain-containing protein [Bacillota bacterium]
MEDIITVKGLTKLFTVHYRDREGLWAAFLSLFQRKFRVILALDNIDLNIKTGEIHALLGPNGAGKSTAIKILSGILHPTAGEVSAMGYVPWKERGEYVRNIGVMFGQKGQITWELPAIDYYQILKEIYKIPRQKFKRNLDYLVDLFQIGAAVQKPIRNLSLGERMRCEFVCALLHEPKLVFLDEPTIGMDLIAKDIVRDYIKRLNRELGTTIILTSHDLGEITGLCKKITIINYGRIVFDGAIDTLRARFSNKKVLEFKFNQALARQDIGKYKIQMTGPATGIVTIANHNGQLPSEIIEIMNNLPVRDLNIYEESIESIIKSIYQHEQIFNDSTAQRRSG